MSSKRRLGVKDSEVRGKLIDAAIALVQQDGCSALTAGRLAKELGLSRQSVHYYFGTIDEIFVEIIRRQTEEVKSRTAASFESGNPLRTIWNFRRATSAVTAELMAMAQRSEVIRTTLVQSQNELTELSIRAVAKYADGLEHDLPASPAAMAVILTSISYTVSNGRELGATVGHGETIEAIEGWLDEIDRMAS